MFPSAVSIEERGVRTVETHMMSDQEEVENSYWGL